MYFYALTTGLGYLIQIVYGIGALRTFRRLKFSFGAKSLLFKSENNYVLIVL
jgi:hypothetical protein